MRVENFQFQSYGDENLDSLMNPKKTLNGLSIFMLLSKCLEKADISGDGIVSEQELSIFQLKDSSEIIKEIQSEIPSYTLDVNDESVINLLNTVKVLIQKNNAINDDINNLTGISKEDFIKKAQESVAEVENTTPEETNITETDSIIIDNTTIDSKDEDIILNENNETNSTDTLWKLIYYDGAEEIFDKIDTDKNGLLSETELAAIAGSDGYSENISMTDLSNAFSFGYHNDIEGDIPTSTDTLEEPEEETTPTETDSPTETSSSPSSGGYAPEPTSYGDNTGAEKVTEKTRTVADIDAEIQEQEQNKTTIKQQAETEIQAQQQQIDTLIAQSELSEEFKAEYDSENTRLQGLIDEKDTAINAQKSLIQDSNAKIASYTTAISDISAQITLMNEQKGKLNSTESADLIQEYNNKIGVLEAKQLELKSKIETENANITNANTAITTLEDEKNTLVTEKDNLLDTLAEKYKVDKDKIETIKAQIATYQTQIKSIETKLQSDLATIDTNIQTLKNERANLVQQEETQKVIAENSIVPDNTPYAITGDIQNFNWASIGYNAEAGKKLADGTYAYANGRTGNHNCLGGVKHGYMNALGYCPFGAPGENIHSAYMAAGILENDSNYREVTGIGIDDLKYLPAGAVVVWSQSTSGTSAACKHGHASVSLGNGYEASDHVCQQYRHVGNDGKPRVFLPITDLAQA